MRSRSIKHLKRYGSNHALKRLLSRLDKEERTKRQRTQQDVAGRWTQLGKCYFHARCTWDRVFGHPIKDACSQCARRNWCAPIWSW